MACPRRTSGDLVARQRALLAGCPMAAYRPRSGIGSVTRTLPPLLPAAAFFSQLPKTSAVTANRNRVVSQPEGGPSLAHRTLMPTPVPSQTTAALPA